MEELERLEKIIGQEKIKKLSDAKIAIFGLGGVGSYTVEALARSGIGTLILIDNDTISASNINRQLYALHSTIGVSKVDVAKNRILDINPNCIIITHKKFATNENIDEILPKDTTYIVDAIDTVTSKISLIEKSKELNIPIISCMGTGNKLDATKFEITDIKNTSVCPLAKVLRHELSKRNIKSVKVLYSKEEPIKNENTRIPGSTSFVPAVAGLLIASEVIKDIII